MNFENGYDCEELAQIRNKVVSTTGTPITNAVIAIVLSESQALKDPLQLPQDVEEFAMFNLLRDGSGNMRCSVDDFRAFIAKRDANHVRMPVEPDDDAIVALGIALSIPRPDGETVADWAERIYKIALNAIKGGQ